MDIPLDEVIYFDAIVSNPATGAAVDADSTPTFAVYEESTDTDIGVGGNLTKRTSLTGNYRGSFTASDANGFEAGKWYSVIASAVVGGVTGKVVARSFRIVVAETTAGVSEVALTTNNHQELARTRERYKQVLYVSKAGNDSNAGTRPTLAKLTLAAAESAASAGTLIVVMDGTYDEHSLGSNGVDWWFAHNSGVSHVSTSDSDRALFDDAGAACVYTVFGHGKFTNRLTNGVNTGFVYGVRSTHASSKIELHGELLEAEHWDGTDYTVSASAGVATVRVKDLNAVSNYFAWTTGGECRCFFDHASGGTTDKATYANGGTIYLSGKHVLHSGPGVVYESNSTGKLYAEVETTTATDAGAAIANAAGTSQIWLLGGTHTTAGTSAIISNGGTVNLVGADLSRCSGASHLTNTSGTINVTDSSYDPAKTTGTITVTPTHRAAAVDSSGAALPTAAMFNSDAHAEPGQGAPAANANIFAKIGYIYKAWRNKQTQTSDTYKLFADDGTTVDQKATSIADDGTTFTRTEVGTGP